MEVEPEIAYRNIEPTEAIEREILHGLDLLERSHPRIITCRMMVENLVPKLKRGSLYRLRIEVSVPGGEIVVSREPRETARAAIKEAFDVARSQLRQRREVESGRPESSGPPFRGRVISLERVEGFGFIRSPERGEVYFHRTGVPNEGFDDLEVGTEVRFVEEERDGATRATSVVPLGRANGIGEA